MNLQLLLSPEQADLLARFTQAVELSQQPQKKWLNEDQAAEYLGAVSKWTLQKWRKEGKIPYVAVGEIFRYDPDDLDKFMNKNKVVSFNEAETKIRRKKAA